MMHVNTNGFEGEGGLNNNGRCPIQNRRKDDRVSVMDNLYVIVDTQPQTMGQVVQISSSGMAFTFVDLNAVSKHLAKKDALSLDLFVGGKGFFLRQVACRLVSKIEEVSASSNPSQSIKRIGVEFQGLTIPQQVQINQLIRRQHHKEV